MRLSKCTLELGRHVYRSTVENTEQLGIMVERCISQVARVSFNTVRGYTVPKYMYTDISNTLGGYIRDIRITKHTGHANGSYDFTTEYDKTVSVKTVMNNNNKICPQKIGQCSMKKFTQYFNKGAVNKSTKDTVKAYIAANLDYLLNEYLENTFCCDHTIICKFGMSACYCLDKVGRLSFARGLHFSLRNTVDKWNESNTAYVRYNGCKLTLGEFQIHNNRDSIKYRFNTGTLLKLVSEKQVRGMDTTEFNFKNGYSINIKPRVKRAPKPLSVSKVVQTNVRSTKKHVCV